MPTPFQEPEPIRSSDAARVSTDYPRLDRGREERFAVIDEMREAFKDVPDDEIERETDRILGTDAASR
jgi:hypothetical protein